MKGTSLSVCILAALCLAPSSSLAYRPPAFDGGCGLFKVSSARTMGKGSLGIGILQSDFTSIGYGKDEPLFQGDTSGALPDKHLHGTTRLTLGYAPSEYCEFSVAPRVYGVYDRRMDATRYDNDPRDIGWFWFRDVLLKLKGTYPSRVWGKAKVSFAVGGELTLDPTFTTDAAYTYSDYRPEHPESLLVTHGLQEVSSHGMDIGTKFLGTFSVGPASAHVNLGYVKAGAADKSWVRSDTLIYNVVEDTLLGARRRRIYAAEQATLERDNFFTWGMGLEVDAGTYVTFLLEASGEKPNNDLTTWTYGSTGRITPGIRLKTPAGLTIEGGCEFKLFEYAASPKWNAVFGLSVLSNVLPKAKPVPLGFVNGRVTIAGSDSVLTAQLTIPGAPPIAQLPDGSFKFSLAPGTYRMRAAAGDSFLWQERALTVADGQTLIADFQLRRKEFPKGTITGKITDSKTGNPVGATVACYDQEKQLVGTPVISDLMTGVFAVSLPPAIYLVQARADGYNVETAPVPVNDKQTFIQNFTLRPIPKAGDKVVLRGIKFKTNRADVMPESFPILDEAAKFLKDNPTIRVEVGGHTDSRGGNAKNQRLSEGRANAVRTYLIQAQGIAPERLTAVGYGPTFPIASNKTTKGRAENRRIEFKVLSQQ